MDEASVRARLAAARVARLATVRPDGRPHVVAVCFAPVGDEIVTAIDAKPKSTRALARLANIAANPAVSLLVDHYEDDWSKLWWARIDGDARVVEMRAEYLDALAAKYEQYRSAPPAGPVIVVVPSHFQGWEHGEHHRGDGGTRY
jgi:PPOX class probable F420-dependent enzyme